MIECHPIAPYTHGCYVTSMSKKDVLAVLPTGFGKSLIYQILPAVFDFLRYRKGGLAASTKMIMT